MVDFVQKDQKSVLKLAKEIHNMLDELEGEMDLIVDEDVLKEVQKMSLAK